MKIAIAGFRGEMPIVDERLLPESSAQLEAQQPAVSGFFIALK